MKTLLGKILGSKYNREIVMISILVILLLFGILIQCGLTIFVSSALITMIVTNTLYCISRYG